MHFVSLIQFEPCYRILKQIKSVVFTFHMFNLQPSWNVHIYMVAVMWTLDWISIFKGK